MKFKRQRHSTSYILLIISTIIMTCASKTGKTGKKKKLTMYTFFLLSFEKSD